VLRRTGQQAGQRVVADVAAMGPLPSVAPRLGTLERVGFGRYYYHYVRIAGNDYSVDPRMIGRFVDVHADLATVSVSCFRRLVWTHQLRWSFHHTVTDPANVVTAAELRTAFKTRTDAMHGPAAPIGGPGRKPRAPS
jgi:Mu transposase-like protein